MYIIHFKGKVNPVEVENYEAEAVKEALLAPHKSQDFIEIRGRIVSMSSISSLEPQAHRAAEREPEPKELPLTPEARIELQAYVKKLGDEMRVKGILKTKESKKIYVSDLVWHKFCVECGAELPAGMARVCSSDCFRKKPLQLEIAD